MANLTERVGLVLNSLFEDLPVKGFDVAPLVSVSVQVSGVKMKIDIADP